MKMKKRLISIAMAAVMAVGSIPAAGALLDGFNNTSTYSDQFTDVPSTAWYYNSVKSAYELGITAGTSASKFSPDQNLTTDQLTVFLARIHAAYHHNEIVEVQNPSSWTDKYYYYVEQYIDSSYRDSIFGGRDNEQRWHFAYWISKALPDSAYTAINNVPDGQILDLTENKIYTEDGSFDEISNRIYMLYRAGILTGNTAYGHFNPKGYVTRAEVTAIITRMIDPDQRKTFQLKAKPTSGPASFLGEYFASDNDASRPWLGCSLEITDVTDKEVTFQFDHIKSGRVILFTAEKAKFTSANTAVANGTACYSEVPSTMEKIKYVLTFTDHNINVKTYGSDPYRYSYNVNFTSTGAMN